MNSDGHVLVIGSASLDVKGSPLRPIIKGTSSPGFIRNSIGGVARNIAENLARLEVETVLLTAVGDDGPGERILGHATAAGIDASHALVVEGGRTSAYMALLSENGALEQAIDDMEVLRTLTPEYLDTKRELFDSAAMVVVDANIPEPTLETIIWICEDLDLPIAADPTSASLAGKLRPHLSKFRMISPNVTETQILCDYEFPPSNRDVALEAARYLVTEGVEIAIVTLSEFGVVYVGEDTQGHIPAIKTKIADQTGAGDAQTAAILFGLLEGIPLDECIRLGITAATLTLRSQETVRHDLSVELLYNELVI